MKKILCSFVVALLISNAFASNVVRIYNQNPQYKVFVNYEACSRDMKKKFENDFGSCLMPIFHVTIPKGKAYVDVKLPEYIDYARVINAYDIGDGVIAKGEFPGEEDCKSWPNYPTTLDNRNSNNIYCARKKPDDNPQAG